MCGAPLVISTKRSAWRDLFTLTQLKPDCRLKLYLYTDITTGL